MIGRQISLATDAMLSWGFQKPRHNLEVRPNSFMGPVGRNRPRINQLSTLEIKVNLRLGFWKPHRNSNDNRGRQSHSESLL